MREENRKLIQEIEDKFRNSRFIILTNYRGLSANDMNLLRRKLRSNKVEYKIFKNTLLSIAVKSLGLENISPYLKGPTAIAFCNGDEIIFSKTLTEFIKAHEGLDIKIGLLDGKVIDGETLKLMSAIPSREVLLHKLVGLLNSGIGNLLAVLSAPINNLVQVLSAKVQQDGGREKNG